MADQGTPAAAPTPAPGEPPKERHIETIRPSEKSRGFYHWLVASTLFAYAIVWLIGLFVFEFGGARTTIIGLDFDFGLCLMAAVLVHAVLSLKMVGADELGGIYFYGMVLAPAGRGLHFVPFGLVQLVTASRQIFEIGFPADDPDQVFHGDDKDPLPEGKVRPIRVVTRAPKTEEAGLLDVQMTLDIHFFVQLAIIDVFEWIANIGTKESASKQLRAIGEPIISEEVATKVVGGVIKDLAAINEKLASDVREVTKHWGVEIISTRIPAPDISHPLSAALAAIPVASATAQATVLAAEATKTKLTREGEGAAGAELAVLKARAQGQKQMKDDLGVDGDAVLAAETARNFLPKDGKGNTVVVGAQGGIADILGAVKAAQGVLQTGGGKT